MARQTRGVELQTATKMMLEAYYYTYAGENMPARFGPDVPMAVRQDMEALETMAPRLSIQMVGKLEAIF